jgi:hypothetical protein
MSINDHLNDAERRDRGIDDNICEMPRAEWDYRQFALRELAGPVREALRLLERTLGPRQFDPMARPARSS